MSDKSELNVVTEVGIFGELDVNDPTKKKVNKKDKSVDELISESIAENKKNL